MDRKKTLISLCIIHLCAFLLCLICIKYFQIGSAPESNQEIVSSITVLPAPDEESAVAADTAESEPESIIETESSTETVEEVESEEFTEAETTEEITEETVEETTEEVIQEVANNNSYPFAYYGNKRLNIRIAPSMDAEIIGKIPSGNSGMVINEENEEWVQVIYGDITGYCSRRCIVPLE